MIRLSSASSSAAVGRALMEYRHARAAVIDAIEYQAMQMDVEIGGGAKALDERDRTGVSLAAF